MQKILLHIIVMYLKTLPSVVKPEGSVIWTVCEGTWLLSPDIQRAAFGSENKLVLCGCRLAVVSSGHAEAELLNAWSDQLA